MTSWSDVAGKTLDFLMNPTRLGAALVFGFLLLVAYVAPMAVVAWTSWENTNRLERAIYALGRDLTHTVATKPQ